MLPELVEKILISAICIWDNTCPSHIVYTFNSLRNVRNFWRVVLDGSAVTKLLTQVHASQVFYRNQRRMVKFKSTWKDLCKTLGHFLDWLSISRKYWREMEQSLDWIMLTIIWMVCNQECMVENERTVLI